jgi:hypothetical protein
MVPTVLSGRTSHELTQVRGWDKNLPSRIRGALPQQQWVRPLQHRGQDLFATLWHHVEDKSAATRSRWPWTWVGDDRVFKQSGQQLGLVGAWYSGQEHRVRLGIDGLLLVVVSGTGKLVVPVDFVVRRPDPVRPGRPCRDQLTWRQVMLDRTGAALQQRGLRLPPPLVVADRGFGDSKMRAHVAGHRQGLWLVEGKRTDVFHRLDGRRMTGQDLRTLANWPWRESSQVPGVRSARRTATSPTYGRVTLVMVDQPGHKRFYLRCRETRISAPRLIRAWGRRSGIEQHVRTLQHLLATEACQVQTEAAYYGHLVWRLWAGIMLLYTTRILCKGRVTMEEMLCRLKHHWRFLNSKLLELPALSWELSLEAA